MLTMMRPSSPPLSGPPDAADVEGLAELAVRTRHVDARDGPDQFADRLGLLLVDLFLLQRADGLWRVDGHLLDARADDQPLQQRHAALLLRHQQRRIGRSRPRVRARAPCVAISAVIAAPQSSALVYLPTGPMSQLQLQSWKSWLAGCSLADFVANRTL